MNTPFRRLGSQAATTRGIGLKEFEKIGELITKVIKGLSENPEENSRVEEQVRNEGVNLCSNFPIYKNLNKGSVLVKRKGRPQL
jgi:Glycine/serine hydroxymethyltransferase